MKGYINQTEYMHMLNDEKWVHFNILFYIIFIVIFFLCRVDTIH